MWVVILDVDDGREGESEEAACCTRHERASVLVMVVVCGDGGCGDVVCGCGDGGCLWLW